METQSTYQRILIFILLLFLVLPNKVPSDRFEAHLEMHVGSVDEREDGGGVMQLLGLKPKELAARALAEGKEKLTAVEAAIAPLQAAAISAVMSRLFCMLICAPRCSSSSTTRSWPLRAASISAVSPLLSCISTSAPR